MREAALTDENLGLLRFYARAVLGVPRPRLRGPKPAPSARTAKGIAVFALSSTLHAMGHAALALLAGRCASLLVGYWTDVGGGSAVKSGALPYGTPLAVAVLGLGAAILKSTGGVGAAYGQAQIAASAGGALRLDVLEALLNVHRLRRPRHHDHGPSSHPSSPSPTGSDPAQLGRNAPARRVAALTAGIREVELGLHTGLLGAIRGLGQLIPISAILVWLAPQLAVAAVLVLLPFALLLGAVRRSLKNRHAAALRQNERLLEAADEAVRHADLWVSFGAEEKARRKVTDLGDALARASSGLEARAAALTGANEVLGALGLVGVLGAASAGWLGRIDGASLLGFTFAFFLAYRPVRDLAEARLAWLRAEAAYDDVRELVSSHGVEPGAARVDAASPAAQGPAEWELAPLAVDELELDVGGAPPLTFSVPPGQIVAVMGPTGAGKTTLLRTLLGLEAARGGDIRYAGASITAAAAGPSARPFAWVPQDAPLLADTLEENVSLGGKRTTHDSLDSIGAAHLEGELGKARLGAGGRAVSGGERQWISLARAISTRQPVLLLDEPTSGLDPEAQGRVLDAIARLRGERSVLIVTHRPEPLAIADQIVRLAEGAGASPDAAQTDR